MNEKQYKYQVWTESNLKRNDLIKQGLEFYAKNQTVIFDKQPNLRKEVAVNSRYLHRGYYCPSPIQNLIFVNARRGKILKRETVRSKPTHYYYFDAENRLLISKWDSNMGSIYTEYLSYSGDYIYGYAFDESGNLVSVSEEYYHSRQIQSYFRSSCYNDENRQWYASITSMEFEKYWYSETGISRADFYFCGLWPKIIESEDVANIMVQGGHYQFSKGKDGLILLSS